MTHHPSETTLLTYTAGSLPAPHRQVIACHLAACPACAAEIRALESTGGALLESLPAALLDEGAEARLLARLERPAPPRARAKSGSARSTLESLVSQGRWRWSGPGIALMRLMPRDVTNSRLDLVRVAPGTALLEHGHTGLETTIVLQGAFDDGIDRYETGDFGEADGGIDHRPTALPGPDCICLIATSAHLRPRSLAGHLVRPLLGM